MATTALPPVQVRTCSAVASAREVGFDSGRMIGASLPASMVVTTSSVKRPGTPVTPMSTDGLALAITSTSVMFDGSATVQPSTALRGWARGSWKLSRSSMSPVSRPTRSTM